MRSKCTDKVNHIKSGYVSQVTEVKEHYECGQTVRIKSTIVSLDTFPRLLRSRNTMNEVKVYG